MDCAAVIITTLNRYKHLSCLIESLTRCSEAENTDIYIGLDYPPTDSYCEGYNKVLKYLENGDFSIFHSFNVLKRSSNYGYFKNINDLKHHVMKTHNTFITMQDDIEVSINFLTYINSALAYYKNDESVIAVSGYSYPLNWVKSDSSNALKTNFVAAEWGIGYWKNKYLKFEKAIQDGYLYQNFISAYKNGKLNYMTDACIIDYANSILNLYYNNSLFNKICDITLRAYISITDRFVIMPALSHVINHGFDGSGIFCFKQQISKADEEKFADNYDYDNQPIDNSVDYVFIPNKKNNFDENRKLLNHFDRRDSNIIKKIHKGFRHYVFWGPKVYKIYLIIVSHKKAIQLKTKKFLKLNF
ncbi:MAG: hypothetical protein MJ076_04725 [Clostridia bacterium]|nr:hypothetical protein [Clostridia bacterium]